MIYKKLVRDKIPSIIQKKGKKPIIHIATDEEYRQKLYEKLREETDEFLKKPSKEELADILEVVYSINELISKDELESLRKRKSIERGSFNNRIILDEVKD